MEFTRKTLTAQPYLCVARSCAFEGPAIAAAMGSAFAELTGALAAQGIDPAGPRMAVYPRMDPDALHFLAAVPATAGDAARATGALSAGELPAGEAVTTLHRGSYAHLNGTHRAMGAWMAAEGLAPAFPFWEVYLDMPGEVPEAGLRTEVWHAVGKD